MLECLARVGRDVERSLYSAVTRVGRTVGDSPNCLSDIEQIKAAVLRASCQP
jgi:hypothetical protein